MLFKNRLVLWAIAFSVWSLSSAEGLLQLRMSAGRSPKISAMHNIGAVLAHNRDEFLSGRKADVVEQHYAGSSAKYQFACSVFPHSKSPAEPLLELHHDPEEVIKHTKVWVNGLVVGMRLCPFTRNADLAGVPPGHIRYEVSTATTIEGMHADWYDSVGRFADTDEEEVSSLMLMFPQFTSDFVRFRIFQSLQEPLFDENVMDWLQEVRFHPDFVHPVAQDEPTASAVDPNAHRSPFPMFQLLRTQMIGRVKKGDNHIFRQLVLDGAKRLTDVGQDKLQAMLDAKDWSELTKEEGNKE